MSATMRKQTARKRRGFTLTEILVAMAIFALGGSAIVALFITNVRLARQAMDYTRAAEISRNVRSLLTQALSRPIAIGTEPVYKFDYPGSSLTFKPNDFIRDYEQGQTQAAGKDLGGAPLQNSVFFKLPKRMFDARIEGEESQRPVQTWMPNDATDQAGLARAFTDGRPEVFRLLPDKLRQAGARDGLDPDDRMFYSFDFTIRRSLARSDVEDPRNPGARSPLEDLFVVHIKVYKAYTFREPGGRESITDPIYEWDFYVSAAR